MDFSYPIYPFLWNYDDMYQQVVYRVVDNTNDLETLDTLKNIFVDKNVISTEQIINKQERYNINFQCHYISDKFEKTDDNIIINSSCKLNYKNNINVFVWDKNNVIDPNKDYHELARNNKKQNINSSNLLIVKDLQNVNTKTFDSSILYIRTHKIGGIFRFSPNNTKIKIKNIETTNEITLYYIMENLIVQHTVFLK